MKKAIASTTNDLTGDISERGGRSPYFLLIDDNGKLLESIKNPFAVGGGGAGFGVITMLAEKDVTKLIVGKAGGNMKSSAEENEIELVEMSGTVEEALKV